MSDLVKIIVSVISALLGGGILFSLLRYFVINDFKTKDDSIKELFSSRNKHNIEFEKHNTKFENHELRIETLEKEIEEMKGECKDKHKEG